MCKSEGLSSFYGRDWNFVAVMHAIKKTPMLEWSEISLLQLFLFLARHIFRSHMISLFWFPSANWRFSRQIFNHVTTHLLRTLKIVVLYSQQCQWKWQNSRELPRTDLSCRARIYHSLGPQTIEQWSKIAAIHNIIKLSNNNACQKCKCRNTNAFWLG